MASAEREPMTGV